MKKKPRVLELINEGSILYLYAICYLLSKGILELQDLQNVKGTYTFFFEELKKNWKHLTIENSSGELNYYCRYSKLEPLLMAHNCHWVSSLGTNVKINIFGTYPVTSGNVKRKMYSQQFLAWRYQQILLFIYLIKSKLLEVVNF